MSRYRIERTLARGGMAEISEAILLGEHGFERKVVLKQLLEKQGDDRDSFIDEAKILSRLHHPGIVSVLDFGVQDGRPFQALEWVDGTDLHDLCDRVKTIPVAIALGIALELAEALDHAHRALDASGRPLGLVHRDVTPDNVLLSRAGEVKLADFGIARANQRLVQTQVGIAKGKLDFMSPEQALGSTVDARADLYALGLVLHVAITGTSLLADEERRRDAWAGTPLVLSPQLDPDVAFIIERAVRPRPADRHASAAEMAAALAEAFDARGRGDARRSRRKWLEAARAADATDPTPAVSPRRALSMLMGMEGFLDLEPGPSPGPGPGPDLTPTVAGKRLAVVPEIAEPTAVVTRTQPMAKLPVAPPKPPMRIRIWAAALVAASAAAVILASMLTERPPPPIAPIEPPPVAAELPPPVAVAATPAVLTPTVAIAKPTPPRPTRTHAPAPPPTPSKPADDPKLRIEAALTARGLSLAELDDLEVAANDPEAIAAAPITTKILGTHLERAHQRLEKIAPKLPIADLKSLDRNYLDLQAAIRANPSPAERNKLFSAIKKLEGAIDALSP